MIDADSAAPMSDDEMPGQPGDEALFDGEPIPLTQDVYVPPFPVDALPKVIADIVIEAAEATQTDPAMPAVSALSTLSASTCGRVEIEIRRGWREPLNLYTATVAEPGERKSGVQQVLIHPLWEVDRQLTDDAKAARAEAETRRQIAIGAAKKALAAAVAAEPAEKDAKMAEAVKAAAMVDAIEIPVIPRLLADDITPEATGSTLADHGGRLAIISAEGGILDTIAGRYSHNVPNMDVYLKGHCGDPLRIDRKNTPTQFVRRPALTLGLMIQPEVLHTIAANRQFRGRGFLARILYAYPASKVGHRKIAADPIGADTTHRYEKAISKLALVLDGWSPDPAVLVLTDAANAAMIAIETGIEPTLAGDGELAPLADWGAKYAGAIARIAGMIHLVEHGPEDGPQTPVEPESIHAAARIGAYFKACAIKAFSVMGADPITADAMYLLARIKRLAWDVPDGEPFEVSERDLMVASSRSRFGTKEALLPAIGRLLDHYYLAPLPASKPTGGRPASPRYAVHPKAAEVADDYR